MAHQLYPLNQDSEIDLRDELNRFLFGSGQEIAKSQRGLLRRMRRDNDGELILCPCVDSLTGEPDRDRWCPISHSEKYLWDEEYMDFYVLIGLQVESILARADDLFDPGIMNIPLVTIFTTYDKAITKEDKVVELILESGGKPETPIKRRRIIRLSNALAYRSDKGRIEYWKLAGHIEGIDSRGITI